MADLSNQVENLNIDGNASSYVPPHLRNSSRRPRNDGEGSSFNNKGSFFGRGRGGGFSSNRGGRGGGYNRY